VPSPAHIRSTIAAIASPPEELRAVAAYHKALSDPTRLRLMQRLAQGPATVTELTSHVDLSQPLVSFHLHRLKAAGVVETRRAGREVICTLSLEALTHFRAREGELLGLAS
jgi:ArsR family transcriptional regulator